MITVEFDGACWPNPKGRASAGVKIGNDKTVLLEKGFYIGRGRGMSSNVAEYCGLIEALKYLNRLSDYLFVLARALNDNGANDVLWVPGANRND